MSRAFVKETAESAAPPERMVDDGPNLVTPEGLAQIEGHIARIEAAMKTETNVLLRETLARDLRYWEIRKNTAEVVQPSGDGTVAFGSTVTIGRKGRQQTFRIVGVDEQQVIAQAEVEFVLKEMEGHATNVHYFGGVQFQQYGLHHVEIYLENELQLRFPLPVIKVARPTG